MSHEELRELVLFVTGTRLDAAGKIRPRTRALFDLERKRKKEKIK